VTLADNDAMGLALAADPNMNEAYPPGCYYSNPQSCPSGGSGVWSDPTGTTQAATSVLANNNGSDCAGVLISDGHNALGTNSGSLLADSPLLDAGGMIGTYICYIGAIECTPPPTP